MCQEISLIGPSVSPVWLSDRGRTATSRSQSCAVSAHGQRAERRRRWLCDRGRTATSRSHVMCPPTVSERQRRWLYCDRGRTATSLSQPCVRPRSSGACEFLKGVFLRGKNKIRRADCICPVHKKLKGAGPRVRAARSVSHTHTTPRPVPSRRGAVRADPPRYRRSMSVSPLSLLTYTV